MSTIPSISLIPSGYKANKVYSVLPTDGAADLTFARTSSANRVNSDNLLEEVATGVPRLDYTDGTCPSLLLEPQSTNLITYPLSFDNAYWAKSGASVTGGFSAPSVDNPTSAFKLVENTSTAVHRLQRNISVTSGVAYSKSVRIKKGANRYFYIGTTSFSDWDFSFIDLDNDTVVSTGSGVEIDITQLTDGWVTISASRTVPSTTTLTFCLGTSTSSSSTSFTGAGADSLFLFGAQLEQQSFATSLMLPNTEGSTVTRVAETASKTGLESYIGQTEGYIYVYFTRNGNEVSRGGLVYLRQASFRGLSINYLNNKLYFLSRNNSGTTSIEIKSSFLINETVKVAIDYNNNGGVAGGQGVFDAYVNGVKAITEGVYNIPDINIDELRLSYGSASGSDVEVTSNSIKEFRNGKIALTDAEYITLTTL